jgi:hypothetical protein
MMCALGYVYLCICECFARWCGACSCCIALGCAEYGSAIAVQLAFMNVCCVCVCVCFGVRSRSLAYYKGDYDTFERTRIERAKHQQSAFEAQDARRKHMQVSCTLLTNVNVYNVVCVCMLWISRTFPNIIVYVVPCV